MATRAEAAAARRATAGLAERAGFADEIGDNAIHAAARDARAARGGLSFADDAVAPQTAVRAPLGPRERTRFIRDLNSNSARVRQRAAEGLASRGFNQAAIDALAGQQSGNIITRTLGGLLSGTLKLAFGTVAVGGLTIAGGSIYLAYNADDVRRAEAALFDASAPLEEGTQTYNRALRDIAGFSPDRILDRVPEGLNDQQILALQQTSAVVRDIVRDYNGPLVDANQRPHPDLLRTINEQLFLNPPDERMAGIGRALEALNQDGATQPFVRAFWEATAAEIGSAHNLRMERRGPQPALAAEM
ncbi:MAG: hypothetical protein GC136_02370 [Alphaproteobacteria bacterium]|nr:hypothetical protein [Alphaproteobacteria bacterium]